MKYIAIFPQTLEIIEAPCNKWSLRRFKQAIKEWSDNGAGPANIYIGTTYQNKEYVCNIGAR